MNFFWIFFDIGKIEYCMHEIQLFYYVVINLQKVLPFRDHWVSKLIIVHTFVIKKKKKLKESQNKIENPRFLVFNDSDPIDPRAGKIAYGGIPCPRRISWSRREYVRKGVFPGVKDRGFMVVGRPLSELYGLRGGRSPGPLADINHPPDQFFLLVPGRSSSGRYHRARSLVHTGWMDGGVGGWWRTMTRLRIRSRGDHWLPSNVSRRFLPPHRRPYLPIETVMHAESFLYPAWGGRDRSASRVSVGERGTTKSTERESGKEGLNGERERGRRKNKGGEK